MNSFSKNPFAKTRDTRIVGNNIKYDENKKIENIVENMNKLKYNSEKVSVEENQLSVKERIDNLKNLDKWK